MKTLLSFISGVAVGAVTSYFVVRHLYQQKVADEISDVRAMFKKEYAEKDSKPQEEQKEEPTKESEKEESDKHDIDDVVRVDYSNIVKQYKPKKENKTVEKPYVIASEDYGEFKDYDRVLLYYYDDGILSDEDGEIVDDENWVVGSDALESYDEYVDNGAVYVRNDRLKCDYKILKDERSYAGYEAFK